MIAGAATAQDQSKYGATEEQQVACMEALSVYKSFKTQKNYADAYTVWQKACAVCPPDVNEGLYIDGVRFIKEVYNLTESTDRKKVLRDSLMLVYDQRMEIFAATDKDPLNRCSILGYKASDYARYFKKDREGAYKMYKESLYCLTTASPASTISGYYLSLFEVFKAAEGDAKKAYNSELLTEYLLLQDYIDANSINNADTNMVEAFRKTRNNLDEIFVQIADCAQMLPVLEQKVNENPKDDELKKKVLRLMNKKDCSGSDFYIKVAKGVYDSDPDPTSAYAIGMSLLKKDDYSGALKYFEEAANGATDGSDRATYYLRAGQVASALGQSSKARGYAKKALALNPKDGMAIILEGDAIMALSGACDDGALGARSVYWLAYDYYARAKSVDPSVSDAASRKMATAKGQFPSKEDIFNVAKKEGESFTVPCVGETTTIRTR
jgi:tetratricopeptide (TPR) repeat protein